MFILLLILISNDSLNMRIQGKYDEGYIFYIRKVCIKYPYVFAGVRSHFYIFDISSSPKVLYQKKLLNPVWAFLPLQDSLLLVGIASPQSNGYLFLYNISDPSSPLKLDSLELPDRVLNIKLDSANNIVGICGEDKGIYFVKVESNRIKVVDTFFIDKHIFTDVAFKDSLIFVSEYDRGIGVYDRNSYEEITRYMVSGRPVGLTLKGDFLFVSADTGGLYEISIKNLLVPEINKIKGGRVLKSTLWNNILCCACYGDGVRCFKKDEEGKWEEVGYYDFDDPLAVMDVDMYREIIAGAVLKSGLYIFELTYEEGVEEEKESLSWIFPFPLKEGEFFKIYSVTGRCLYTGEDIYKAFKRLPRGKYLIISKAGKQFSIIKLI